MKVEIKNRADACIERKKNDLVAAMAHADPRSRDFIAVQMAMLPAERVMIDCLADAFEINPTQRHVGMALAQSSLEALLMAGRALELAGADSHRELYASFFGRLVELAEATGVAAKIGGQQ